MRHSVDPMTEKVTADCSDCRMPTTMTKAAIEKGAKNRDPGEIICPSCNASRTVLIRKLMALPSTLHEIQALRMVTR